MHAVRHVVWELGVSSRSTAGTSGGQTRTTRRAIWAPSGRSPSQVCYTYMMGAVGDLVDVLWEPYVAMRTEQQSLQLLLLLLSCVPSDLTPCLVMQVLPTPRALSWRRCESEVRQGSSQSCAACSSSELLQHRLRTVPMQLSCHSKQHVSLASVQRQSRAESACRLEPEQPPQQQDSRSAMWSVLQHTRPDRWLCHAQPPYTLPQLLTSITSVFCVFPAHFACLLLCPTVALRPSSPTLPFVSAPVCS